MPKKSIPFLIAIFLTLSFSSCTCIYFNTFHNIRKNFNTAEKTRVKGNRDKARGGEIKKYSDAITKSSRILERHPTSSWVDDALYIIGASYYYLGEFDKSSRKFKELFANYPESEYIDRSRILLAKAKLQLKEETEAIVLFEEIFASGKNREMKAEAARSLGYYYFENKEFDKADKYFQSLIDSLGDSNDRLRAYLFKGDGNFDRFMFLPAFNNYDEALDENPDTLQYYHLQYSMAECEYFLGKLSSGLERIKKLADDELYYDSLAVLRLKIAEGYEWDGDMDAAISVYEKITIESEGRNEAAIAYYELGLIHQYDLEDYSKAQEYYGKARSSKRNSPIYEDATKRASKLALLEQYNQSARTTDQQDTVIALSSDEINQMGENQFLLGELFYFDLEKPDSAAQAYQLLLERYPQSSYAPRALISLSYINRRDYYDTTASDSLLRLVLSDYAHYDEAEEVINMLGLAGTAIDSGYAAITFEQGESFLEQILELEEKWYYSSPLDAIIDDSLARLKEKMDSLGQADGSVFQAIDSLYNDSLTRDTDSLKQPTDSLVTSAIPEADSMLAIDSTASAFADTASQKAPPRRLSDLMSELRKKEAEKKEQERKEQKEKEEKEEKEAREAQEEEERIKKQAEADSTVDIGASIIDSIMKIQATGDSSFTKPVAVGDLTVPDSLTQSSKTISPSDSGMVIDTTVTGPLPDSLINQSLGQTQNRVDSLARAKTPETALASDTSATTATSDSTDVPVEEEKIPNMEILDSLWTEVVQSSRGQGHDEVLNLFDSTKYYFRYVVDSFPHSRYNSQSQYVLLWTYDNFLATGDSLLKSLYADYVDSFPETEYASLIASKYNIRPRQAPTRPKRQLERELDDAPDESATDSTESSVQPTDTIETETSANSAFITDEDGKRLPPAEEYFLQFDLPFKYPIEALPYQIEGVFYFHIRINYGQVEEFRMINKSRSQDLNEHLEKVIIQARFDDGRMPPELFDSWFYFSIEVRIPSNYR